MKRLFLILFVFLLLAVPAESATRYVHSICTNAITTYNPTGGGGSGACTGGSATVYSTINNAISAGTTVAGDRLEIRAGTYAERVQSSNSGTSFSNAVTYAAYSGETVTFQNVNFNGGSESYIIFENLIIDVSGGVDGQAVYLREPVHHIRFTGCTLTGGSFAGMTTSPSNSTVGGHEIINCIVHSNGTNALHDHGIYLETINDLVEGSTFYNNAAYGVQIAYTNGGTIVRNNIVRNNCRVGSGGGIVIYSSPNAQVYNNIVYENDGGSGCYAGIQITGSGGTKVYNNTITGNTNVDAGIEYFNNAGVAIRNNIVYNNGGTAIADFGGNSSVVLSDNLTTDPDFVNAAADNYHINETSPAIDATTFSPQEFSTDYDGDSRPQGLRWDIGADEFGAPPSSFSVTIPNGGETWQTGLVKTITWASVIEDQNNTQTFNATGSWVAPTGVTSVQVDAWGGGGGGGGNNTAADGGGGGGGGAFARETAAAVTPTTSYTVTVGTGGAGGVGAGAAGNGGDSWFNTSGTVMADGGFAGSPPAGGLGGVAGAGGSSATSIGDSTIAGGAGGTGRDNGTGTGGGGGGSAGSSGLGGVGGVGTASPGIAGTAGAGTPSGAAGGVGGAAGANGNPGNTPGAGGGGSGDTGTRTGGAGANGRVVLSWVSGATVHIELSRNGGTDWEDIVASTADDGSYDWTVAGSTGANNIIRITSLAGGAETDNSDAAFTIAASGGGGTITATSISGQRFKKGTSIPFGWTYENVTGNVRIDLSRDDGSTWTTVIASTAVTSSAQSWVAETPVSSLCKFRVVSLNDGTVVGTSAGNFRIGGSLTLLGQ